MRHWRSGSAAALAIRMLAMLALLALPGRDASAQEPPGAYPSRTILMIVPYPPGGPPDVVSRVLAPLAGDVLGKPIVVENRPGASTSIGVGAVARAAPDGYTILASDIAQVVAPSIMKSLSFDPTRDFKHVVLAASSPFTFVIDPKLPITSFPEIVAHAKAHPGEVKIGHSGLGTPPHLATLSVMQATGAPFLLVPYRGVAAAVSDVIAGHIQGLSSAPSTTVALATAGQVRMLGVSGAHRLAALPDVPTFQESGITLKGFDRGNWFGVSVPAATADEIVDKLNRAFNTAIANADAAARLAKVGITVLGGSSAEFSALFQQQIGAWREVMAEAGIKPE